MDLINKQVTHKIFGKGKVVRCDGSYVRINFPSGNKKFVFPDAFGPFLTLVDQRAANFVEKLVKIQEEERKAEKQRQIELRTLQNIKRRHLLEREKRARRQKTRKIHPRSQSVFWCEPQELDEIFSEWNVFTGEIKSGRKKGQPKRLALVGSNSACLLTIRDSDTPEKERRIVGVFMVNEFFNSRRCTDGYIPAHSEFKMRLSQGESEGLFFWNYYLNKGYPHRMTWNTGRHRYFDNIWMAQILRDIIAVKKELREREHAQRFFDYFCQMNRVEETELSEPAGALLQT